MACPRSHARLTDSRCEGRAVRVYSTTVEQIINLHIEKLPEGVYLATTDDCPGLVAQGRTVAETVEIARDVAKKLIEARAERSQPQSLEPVGDTLEYPLIVGT